MSTHDEQSREPQGIDRRTSPRVPASAVPDLKARLLAGPDVRLVDLSRRGVLLETQTRLLPGSPVRLKFVAQDATLVLKGAVVRSSVCTCGEHGLIYRTAVTFDEDIAICDDSLWSAPPMTASPEPSAVQPDRDPAPLTLVRSDTPASAPAAAAFDAAARPALLPPSALLPDATVITLFADDPEALRSMLAANDW